LKQPESSPERDVVDPSTTQSENHTEMTDSAKASTLGRFVRGAPVSAPRIIGGDLLPPLRLGAFVFPLALVALICIGSILYPTFRTTDNFRNILTFASVGFIVALGETLVLLGRAVDLSVGSMVALSGTVFAKVYLSGQSVWVSILAALGIGFGLGFFVNGLIITKFRVSFLIVTLGTFAIFRSQANVLLAGQSLTVDSSVLDWLANGRIGPIPSLVVQAAVIYFVMLVLLRATTFGRAVYAVGANPSAARVAGIPVDRVVMISFAICGGLAAYAGIIVVGQLGSAQPTAGTGMELIAIAAVLVGGTRLSGGYGGVTGTVVGVLFLSVLTSVLLSAGVSSFWLGTVSGTVLILAVALDRSRREA
jgi:ribose transport system permease protein